MSCLLLNWSTKSEAKGLNKIFWSWLNAETHTYVHREAELKDCTGLNKSESFLNFIIKQALISLEVQGFLHV